MYSRYVSYSPPCIAIRIVFVTWCIRSSPRRHQLKVYSWSKSIILRASIILFHPFAYLIITMDTIIFEDYCNLSHPTHILAVIAMTTLAIFGDSRYNKMLTQTVVNQKYNASSVIYIFKTKSNSNIQYFYNCH